LDIGGKKIGKLVDRCMLKFEKTCRYLVCPTVGQTLKKTLIEKVFDSYKARRARKKH
jgi:hypothetical protein